MIKNELNGENFELTKKKRNKAFFSLCPQGKVSGGPLLSWVRRCSIRRGMHRASRDRSKRYPAGRPLGGSGGGVGSVTSGNRVREGCMTNQPAG